MAQKFTNVVMDERIVRLNEFKEVKMAQLSKGKRPAAKFNKLVAIYLLTNWDNLEALKTCLDAMRKDMPAGCEEVMQIYDTRISELEPEQPKANKEHKTKAIAFSEFKRVMEGVCVETIKEFSDFTGDTKQEYMNEMQEWWKSATDKERKETIKSVKIQFGAFEKANKSERKAGAPKTHKVGDRHPKHPWIWTEYQKGKFDWRIDPALKQKPGKKAGETANQSKKKKAAGKAKKAEPAAAPKLTLTELLAKPTPQGLSKPQHNVIKSLKKGFRLRKDGDALWLTDAAGNNERTEKGVLKALQRRYKIDYIPDDIWYNGKI